MLKTTTTKITAGSKALLSKFKRFVFTFWNKAKRLNFRKLLPYLKYLALAVFASLIFFVALKAKDWYIIAKADGQTINRFELWEKMEKTYGLQTIEDMVNDRLLDNALKDVKVDRKTRDEAYRRLDKQLEKSSSLEASMVRRGLTKSDLRRQIDNELRINEKFKDKAEPTEYEIENEYAVNRKTTYKDKELAEVREDIVAKLRKSKLNSEFMKWFEQVKKDAEIVKYEL